MLSPYWSLESPTGRNVPNLNINKTDDDGLRIAHIIVGRCDPDAPNGVETSLHGLASAQATLGHSVRVLAVTDKPNLDIAPVIQIPVKIDQVRFAAPSLIRALEDWRPDLLHLHSVFVPEHLPVTRWARRVGVPYVVTPHGGLNPVRLLRRKVIRKKLFGTFIQRPVLNNSAFIHSVGDEDEIRGYNFSGRVIVVPNGVPDLMLGARPTRLRRSADNRTIVFLGRLDLIVKGLDLLISGFAAANLPSTNLVLAGPYEESERSALERLAQRSGCEKSVIFTGPVAGERKRELLAAADAYAQTSRSDGCSMSVLEAAAAALPLVLSPRADPMSQFLRGGGALVIENLTPERIAAALRRIFKLSGAERVRMGMLARSTVEREFRWAPLAQKIVESYREFALDGPSRKGEPTLRPPGAAAI